MVNLALVNALDGSEEDGSINRASPVWDRRIADAA